MATNNMTLKLLIDSKSNKVLFAEASKDFVDFLFFLLSLPIGTVIKLLNCESMVGSIANLYTSFNNLNETYMQPSAQKDQLLNPGVPASVTNFPPLTTLPSSSCYKKFYICCGTYCKKGITDKYCGAPCPGCSSSMCIEIKYVAPTYTSTPGEGYVKGIVAYMISDDLSVTPIVSLISSIPMMNKMNISNANVLEEKEVQVGTEKGLEILKASLRSTTVLTDVFLGMRKASDRFEVL